MTTGRRGSALLTVLWITAALAAVAFSLSSTVLSETDHTSTTIDGLRCYYLAAGAIHRCSMEVLWSVTNPAKRSVPKGSTAVDYTFPSGDVRVEIIPEAAKLNVNFAPPAELSRLLGALGVDPDRAREIAAAIVDWRRPALTTSAFDSYYLSLTPSFRARHASLQEIEELLLVKGVTPDLFYGTYIPAPEGSGGPRLIARQGLVDCLSVYGSQDQVDANTASPAVLAAVGLSPFAISTLVERRRVAPLDQQQLGEFMQTAGAAAGRLRVEGNSMATFRATARLRLSDGRPGDLKRTVAAVVKYMPAGTGAPIHILRWYDTAWGN
jgi:general secretion pathway protein K